MSPTDESGLRELNTWQEIADYLGVSVRTAQTWRKDGLPVRKLGGRVIASTAELDQWQISRAKLPEAPAAAAAPRSARRRRFAWTAAALAAALLLAALWLTRSASELNPARMVRYEIRRNVLAVFDENGQIAWTREFDHPLHEPAGEHLARSQFADLDGDGNPELLFLAWDGPQAKGLYCFRNGPEPVWISPIGRTVTDSSGESFASDYVPAGLLVLRRPRPDGARIVLASRHASSWPARIAALGPEGSVFAEHWHAGPLYSLDSGDLDGDGIEELFAGGANENFRATGAGAILLVLDSAFGRGQGPFRENGGHTIRDIPFVSVPAALLFPEVAVPSAPPEMSSAIDVIRWTGNYLEAREIGPDRQYHIHYQFNRMLEIVNVSSTSNVMAHLAPNASPAQGLNIMRQKAIQVRTLCNRFADPGTQAQEDGL